MDLSPFILLTNELLNKDTYIFPEEENLIILDSKSSVWMNKNGKYDKHTRHIYRRVNFVINCEFFS